MTPLDRAYDHTIRALTVALDTGQHDLEAELRRAIERLREEYAARYGIEYVPAGVREAA